MGCATAAAGPARSGAGADCPTPCNPPGRAAGWASPGRGVPATPGAEGDLADAAAPAPEGRAPAPACATGAPAGWEGRSAVRSGTGRVVSLAAGLRAAGAGAP